MKEVAEELLNKDDVDYRSISGADTSRMRLLHKPIIKQMSVLDTSQKWKRNSVFRERLKSVAAPMAERKAVW